MAGGLATGPSELPCQHRSEKGGLCFQWATELLLRLDKLKLETLELHWAESFERTASEHNVIVVTAVGQPFQRGILLDNWRYGDVLSGGLLPGTHTISGRKTKRKLSADWENDELLLVGVPSDDSLNGNQHVARGKQNATYGLEELFSPCKRVSTQQFV